MGNPHLHGAELKTEHTPQPCSPLTASQRKLGEIIFYQDIDQNGSAARRKKDEETYYTCKPEGYFGILKSCPPAFLDQKISSLCFQLSFLFKLL